MSFSRIVGASWLYCGGVRFFFPVYTALLRDFLLQMCSRSTKLEIYYSPTSGGWEKKSC